MQLTHTFIAHVLAAGLLIWFALLALIILGRLLRDDLDTTGLLRSGKSERAVAPERVLAMAVFPAVLTIYTLKALHADMTVIPPALPNLSDDLIMLLTGSNSLYLAGKIARTV